MKEQSYVQKVKEVLRSLCNHVDIIFCYIVVVVQIVHLAREPEDGSICVRNVDSHKESNSHTYDSRMSCVK